MDGVNENDLYVWTTFAPGNETAQGSMLRRGEELSLGLQLNWEQGCVEHENSCYEDKVGSKDRIGVEWCLCYNFPCPPPGDGFRA